MDWHRRYLQQASWTRPLRDYLLEESLLGGADRVLEVGCGTGAVLIDVARHADSSTGRQPSLFGLDLLAPPLKSAQMYIPETILTQGDAHQLPFANHSFEITLCHFLLLWLSDPLGAIREMGRVTRPSGHVLALAEPDYTRRVDGPAELALLGQLQQRALWMQGADASIGSRIADLFDKAGLTIVETGTIAPRNISDYDESEWRQEWDVLRSDLADQVLETELNRLQDLDYEARRAGRRVLYVPTFFVHAQV
jgi:SAM-dependent methyltransferase